MNKIVCKVNETIHPVLGDCIAGVKLKSSKARSLPVESLLPQNVGSIINYLQ